MANFVCCTDDSRSYCSLAVDCTNMTGQKRKSKNGVSMAVDIHAPTGPLGTYRTHKQTYKLSQQNKRRMEAKRRRFDHISGI